HTSVSTKSTPSPQNVVNSRKAETTACAPSPIRVLMSLPGAMLSVVARPVLILFRDIAVRGRFHPHPCLFPRAAWRATVILMALDLVDLRLIGAAFGVSMIKLLSRA